MEENKLNENNEQKNVVEQTVAISDMTVEDNNRQVAEEMQCQVPVIESLKTEIESTKNKVQAETVRVKKEKRQKVIASVMIILIAILSFVNGYKYKEWKVMSEDKPTFDVQKINGVKELLEEEHLYSKDIKEQRLTEGAIAGMVDSVGDIYTRYVSADAFEDFEAKTSGKYSGIGVTVSSGSDGSLNVSEVYKDNSAAKAGILPNDKIIKIDGKAITAMNPNEAVGLIRGEIGTDVVITVLREGKEIDVTVTRSNIVLPVIDSKILEGNIAYIKVSSFNGETQHKFNEAYNALSKQNPKGIIVDLRDNGGGLLNVGVDMASKFVESGKIVTIERKKSNETMNSTNVEKIKLPLVVLVNQNTASASEIFAGAIKDHKRGTIVGTNTFGKGLVQNTYQIGEKSLVIITTAKYLTPNGEDINKKGIKPDVEVTFSKEDMLKGQDNQLNKAIEVLEKQINK